MSHPDAHDHFADAALPDEGFATQQVHAGEHADAAFGARIMPIYLSAGFRFDDFAHARDRFAGDDDGYVYTRAGNPSNAALERRLAAIERGRDAVVVASGQAALTVAVLAIAQAGDHVLSAQTIYSGTRSLFTQGFGRFGIEVEFVDDPRDLEEWRRRIRPNTRADLRRVDRESHRRGRGPARRGRRGARRGRAVHRRQHARDALPRAPDRARRRRRRALREQVPLGARRGPRRGDRRRRHVRLVGAARRLPAPQPARHRAAGAQLPRGARRGRLHGLCARRHGRAVRPGALAVQRVPDPAGRRDALAARGSASRPRPP